MNFYEKEAAEEQKQQLYIQQHGLCSVCCQPIMYSECQAAHRIPKHKWLLKKYGPEVINHRFNLRITHAGNCNDAVMIMPESIEAKELIERIQEDIKK